MSQNILVTGTNSGFGRLITLSLAQKGHQVFATMRDVAGRNKEAADELSKAGEAASGAIHVVEMDVADTASVDNAIRGVLEKAGHLDVLVNNAGYAAMGLEETLTAEQLRTQFEVNVIGPHNTARAALPSMKARGKGLIVQVSSGLGRLVFPLMGAYCASKAALESLSDAYRYELKATGVELTIVQPGAFPTDFAKRTVLGADAERAKGYGPMEKGVEMMFKNFEQMFSGPNVPHPQLVADAVVTLTEMEAGKRPARVVVDPMTGQMAENLNKAHADVQKMMLGHMGMGPLAD